MYKADLRKIIKIISKMKIEKKINKQVVFFYGN